MFPPQQILLGHYRYDPLDRLISLAQPTVPNHRFYCKSRLVTEIQGALRHSFVQHGDLLLAQHRHENDALGTTLLATDLQRSVLHTLEKNTGRQAIAYAPYGHRSAESGLTSLLGFNGERPDPVTGHYLLGNGYRAFNPVLMRFNSPDSLSPFRAGGINAYAYCSGDSVNKNDPTGHFQVSAFIKPKMLNWLNLTRSSRPTNTALIGPGTTDMGLFGKLESTPHLIDKIIQQLEGSDIVSLARTSKTMKNVVYSAARPLPNELDGVKRITQYGQPSSSLNGDEMNPGYGGTFYYKDREQASYVESGIIQRIGSGTVEGHFPAQLPRAGIRVGFSSHSIARAHIPNDIDREYFNFEGENKNWTIRALT